MINFQIGVNKLVGKVLINLLCHAKFITSRKVSHLCNQHNYHVPAIEVASTPKQIDLASVFVVQAAVNWHLHNADKRM